MRDKCAGAFLNEDEKVKFANSKANLHEMDSNLNRSKGDLSTTDWMNKPNDRGQKPKEIFNISDKQEEKIWRDEKEAREEYKKTLDLAEKRANQEGRNSRISEFQRSAKFTTQAVAVALMAKLTKTIFQEVIKWLSEKEHKSKDLINRIKKAINSFVFDFKNNVLISIDVATTTILTQLFGEIIPMIKKAMLFLSIGGKSAVDIAKYLNDPSNTGKDTSTKMLEIGEIFVTGLTAAGGVALGMSITITLTKFLPQLATFQIPLLGSTAELLGIFFGGLTAGICGAIVMNIIEGKLSGNMLNENDLSQIDKIENVLKLQNKQFGVYENIVAQASSTCATNIVSDFVQARKKLEKIRAQKDEPIKSDNEDKFDCLTNLIGDL